MIKEEIKIDSIITLIENIPLILQYFVPGFLFVSILCYVRSIKVEEYHTIIWSIAISYIIVVAIHSIVKNVTGWSFLLISIITGLLSGCVFAKIIDISGIRKVLLHFGKTANSNIWKDVIDFDIGTTAIFFMKGSDKKFAGTIDMIEETDGSPWVILRDYQTNEKVSTNKPYLTRLAVNLENVDHIELYYQPDTKQVSH